MQKYYTLLIYEAMKNFISYINIFTTAKVVKKWTSGEKTNMDNYMDETA